LELVTNHSRPKPETLKLNPKPTPKPYSLNPMYPNPIDTAN
jgi:hypothetical protein